jgi:hypothetical protein
MENSNQTGREEVFSKPVKAGKRTYFFDVKKTRNNDYFLTITESKRVFESDDKVTYEKHKIFLYQEDFEKFIEGMKEAVDFVTNENPNFTPRSESHKDSDEMEF